MTTTTPLLHWVITAIDTPSAPHRGGRAAAYTAAVNLFGSGSWMGMVGGSVGPRCRSGGRVQPGDLVPGGDGVGPARSRSPRIASVWSSGVDTGPAVRAASQHGHRQPAFAPIAVP
ncbi:MAG: hypothetical protein ACRDR6_20805 [Pseudonocardiaceae bacterium]